MKAARWISVCSFVSVIFFLVFSSSGCTGNGGQTSIPGPNGASPFSASNSIAGNEAAARRAETARAFQQGDAEIQRVVQQMMNRVFEPKSFTPPVVTTSPSTAPPNPSTSPTLANPWLNAVAKKFENDQHRELAKTYASEAFLGAAARDPFKMAKGIDTYLEALRAMSEVQPEKGTELLKSGVGLIVDGQGLIWGLPYVGDSVLLQSTNSSRKDVLVRSGINRLLVARSVLESEVYSYCVAQNGKSCEPQVAQIKEFRKNYDALLLAYAFADNPVLGAIDSPYQDLLIKELNKASQFYFGIAEGLFNGAYQAVDGVVQLVTHPENLPKIAILLGDALVHLPRTFKAIKAAINQEFDTVLHGTPRESGEVIGRVIANVILASPTVPFSSVRALATTGIEAASKSAAVATVKGLIEDGTLGIWNRAFVRATERVAVAGKIEAATAAGKLAADESRALASFAKAFPRGADVALTDRAALRGVMGADKAMSAAPLAEVEIAGVADRQIAAAMKTNPAELFSFFEVYGPRATVGIVSLSTENFPAIFQAWQKAGSLDQLANLGREVSSVIDLIPDSLAHRNLQVLNEAALALSEKGVVMSQDSLTFHVRKGYITDWYTKSKVDAVFIKREVEDSITQFTKIENSLAKVTPLSVTDVEVVRGIKKEFTSTNGTTAPIVADEIFLAGPHNFFANGRYSGPGDRAIYTVVGKPDKEIFDVIRAETRQPEAQFASAKFSFERVLDLTGRENPVSIQVGVKALLSKDYSVTRQIGFLAGKRGFQAILAPSAEESGFVNLIVLEH